MLELDLAISPFSHLAARAAYKTTRFKIVNQKLVDKFRSRLIPSVHLEILKLHKIPNNFQVYGRAFESFVKRQFGAGTLLGQPEAYHYYVDAVTHPNMPFKQIRRYADSNVMAICHKMWCDNEMAFPVLADALEDQDFLDLEYLNHLRTHPQFSRANFVLQFFLNKRIGWPKGMRTSHRPVGPVGFTGRQVTPAEREQLNRRFAGFHRTAMNHPIQSHIRDLMEQLRDDEVRGRLLDLPNVTLDRGTLIIGEREYPVLNVQIQERPDEDLPK